VTILSRFAADPVMLRNCVKCDVSWRSDSTVACFSCESREHIEMENRYSINIANAAVMQFGTISDNEDFIL
jgi:hypothetical protein